MMMKKTERTNAYRHDNKNGKLFRLISRYIESKISTAALRVIPGFYSQFKFATTALKHPYIDSRWVSAKVRDVK